MSDIPCERSALVDVYGTTQHQLDCKLPYTGAESFGPGDLSLGALGLVVVVAGVLVRRLALRSVRPR